MLTPATSRYLAEVSRVTATEMQYMRKTAGYIWTDYKTRRETAKEVNITPVLHKIQEYRRNRLQHTNRMTGSRIPITTGRRNQVITLRRLLGL